MLFRESSEHRVVLDTPAKINLFLQVLNRRPDGYHNINSLFQAVSLFDTLEIERTASPGCAIEVLGTDSVPGDQSNLVAVAYRAMTSRFELDGGLAVRLTKRIPSAAGLGGGSSDAAATILACNRLFRLRLSFEKMARIGASVGSDVPFFFSGGQALVQGRGEIVRDVSFPFDYQLVLATPPLAIGTAQAYASLKRGLTNPKAAFTFRSGWDHRDVVEYLRVSGNDFEEALCESHPVLGRIKSALLEAGALLVRLSGSGPTLFGVFGQLAQIEEQKVYNNRQWRSIAVRPIGLPREP